MLQQQGKAAYFQTRAEDETQTRIDRENKLRAVYQKYDSVLGRFAPDTPEHRAAIIARDAEVARLWS